MPIANNILRKSLSWMETPVFGMKVAFIHDDSSDANNKVPSERKSWYDTRNDVLYVRLSKIRYEIELDRIVLSEIIAHKGLEGVLGKEKLDSLGRYIFDNLYANVQDSLLGEFMGDRNKPEDRAVAGRHYIASVAKKAIPPVAREGENYELMMEKFRKAGKQWDFVVQQNIKLFAPEIWDNLYLDRNTITSVMGAALRQYLSTVEHHMNLDRERTTNAAVREQLLILSNREYDNLPIDTARVIRLGETPATLIEASPRLAAAPLELPAGAFYGNDKYKGGNGQRFIKASDDDIKKNKHPFPLSSICNIKYELENPLAVFYSRTRKDSTVVMLESEYDSKHFCVPISPREIHYNREEGRHFRPGSGYWVNNIDSVHPRIDMQYLSWLTNKDLIRYLAPDFQQKWFQPAVEKLNMQFDEAFERLNIRKPSDDECKKILSANPVYSTSGEEGYNEGPLKRQYNPAEVQEPSGLLLLYAGYRETLESATKVVNDFEKQNKKEEIVNISISSSGIITENKAKGQEPISREDRREKLRQKSEEKFAKMIDSISTKGSEIKIKK